MHAGASLHACGRIPVYMRHGRADLLDAAWGLAKSRIMVSFICVYRAAVWFDFVGFALLLAFVIYWVGRCIG